MITRDYIVLDLETTGLSPKYEKIIEIGAVKVQDGRITDTFSTFVNPGRTLPERIIELTGITDENVKDAPYIEEIIEKFLEFAGDDILVGHNLLFDFSFIKKAAVNQKISIEKNGIDTLRLARRFLPELESRTLTFLCDYYGIKLNAHRALNDALATHELYDKLRVEFGDKEKDLFIPARLIYNVKREVPVTNKQVEHILRLAQRHGIEVEHREKSHILSLIENISNECIDVVKLTKNEASRLIDYLLANFGR